MLLIASQSLKSAPMLTDLAREMSLPASFFSTPAKLTSLLERSSRRLVILGDQEIVAGNIEVLRRASSRTGLAVLLVADRARVASSDRASLLDEIQEIDNLEWVGAAPDRDALHKSATRSRRRLLRSTRGDIERAFDNFEFVVRYQPKVERAGEQEWRTREAEALIRWKHPEHGLVGPSEFLPEIDAYGHMGRLTEFVLRKSAAQLAAWHEQGLRLTACVNLASSLLNEPGIAARYASAVREFGFGPEYFTFEVIEQAYAEPDAPHVRTLNELRAEGFRLCLDDFRVAAASLSSLEKVPFDEIKIHAAALRKAQDDPTARAVLAAVTGLAHNLGMSVCAEGVEDQATFEFLKTIRCDKMQGFLISEAVLPHIIRSVYSTKDMDVGDVA
ncbi:MAG: EAL domain-containing protein [Woeseiaceae bacterium]|jgi:EAL domain-containing protein (putative c-di-GMP-specific phosphodiesterase class I)|nr:EAL domain-containing protein [Woeseiaceae bacterium]